MFCRLLFNIFPFFLCMASINPVCIFKLSWGRDSIVVGFTTTYAISAYHHWCCGGRISTTKIDRQDITKISLKVALNTMNQPNCPYEFCYFIWKHFYPTHGEKLFHMLCSWMTSASSVVELTETQSLKEAVVFLMNLLQKMWKNVKKKIYH